MFRKIVFRHREPAPQIGRIDTVVEDVPSDDPRQPTGANSQHLVVSPDFHFASREQDLNRTASLANSVFPGAAGQSSLSTGTGPHDPLGLHLVSDHPDPKADIIFVHGLGGTARKTWCWERKLENFWPLWLAEEEGLSSYRVFTYGYNSNFKGASTNLNIFDFAKDLLFHMLTFSGGYGGDYHPIGQRAIIFVAHSMGGLVVKKAYSLGKYDRDYTSMISSVYGMVFLATPHRGTQYAKMLNHILSAAPLGAPPKAYLSDLDTQSSALQDINEQFRTTCENLSLVSFFETLKTSLGVTKIRIVEKEAAVLGYPHEMSCPLNADHHNVCKFRSREDENYISVKNVLKLWALKIRPTRPTLLKQASGSNYDVVRKLEATLGIREGVDEDLNALLGKVMAGTCGWITRTQEYAGWIRSSEYSQSPRIFWLVGLPATGKTMLASVVVDHMRFRGENYHYHFFSAGHQAKRKAAYCLRSIASQLALANEEFRSRLLVLHEESGLVFTSQDQDFNTIWDKVFEGIIFKMRFSKPLFWVLDAIDEAESQSILISHLMRIQSSTNIRIFLTSRPMKMPSTSSTFEQPITTYFMSKSDTADDIWAYVNDVIYDALPDDDDFRGDMVEQVLAKASGSFLWVKLTLDTLKDSWHTEDDIRKALTELPEGMGPLYERMLSAVAAQPPRLQLIANRILTWAACSWRPLSIAELQVALKSEFKGFVKLEDTIVQICGHFLFLDNSRISLIHATARDFLLEEKEGVPAFISSRKGHEYIATTCLEYLSTDKWRRVFKATETSVDSARGSSRLNRLLIAEKDSPFLGYATCYWAYHVSKSSIDSRYLAQALKEFLTGYCLSWVEGIALSSNLRYLTRSAQYLKIYAKRLSRKSNSKADGSPLSLTHPPENDSKSIQLWAVDFIRIVGKFGLNLIQSPSSVYRLVPPFCPSESMIGKMYGTVRQRSISVTGLSTNCWDDCLATVSLREDETASNVLATDSYFVVLHSSSGAIAVWYAETCQQARILYHGEYVPLMALNRSRVLLVTAGIETYRIWDVSSGEELYRLQKTTQTLTMAIAFGATNSELIVGLDDCSVMSYDLQKKTDNCLFAIQQSINNYEGCPCIMKFSPDVKKVVMAWRGKPPLLWDMTLGSEQSPQRCRISHHSDAICAPELIEWQPDGDFILILCQNTKLVEWHFYDDEQAEFDHIKAREMTVSQDGNFLLSSDNLGTISVWTFPRLNLLYRLVNDNEFIRSLAFSPNGQRFYDTRNSVCNVWEPDALVRSDEQDFEDHSSIEESSVITEPIISRDESSQSHITALAPHAEDQYYCCGREDGIVMIYDAVKGEKLRRVYSHSSTSSVIALVWSASGKYIVSADDSGRIIAKRLEVKELNKWGVFGALDLRLDEPVQQLLLNNAEKLLLISTASADRIWNLRTKKQLCARHWGYSQSRRWIEHPFNDELILWVDHSIIRTFEWSTLESTETIQAASPQAPLDPASPTTPTSLKEKNAQANLGKAVHWVALTRDKRYLIYQILPTTKKGHSFSANISQIKVIPTSNMENLNPSFPVNNSIDTLTPRVKHLIGTYQDMLVFLDHDFWLSTWKIDDDVSKVKRHFFLPRDWLNTGTLQMATLNPEGALFCPKRGDVAIVRYGMKF